MTGFDVDLPSVDAAAKSMVKLGQALSRQAVELEGQSAAVPAVGDVQSGMIFQQAYFDWAQTRFEDLSESAAKISEAATKLQQAIARYRNHEEQVAAAFTAIISDLDGA